MLTTGDRTISDNRSGGHSVNDAEADCEALVGAVLPFAEQMLSHHGGFIPFGGAMRPDGQIVCIGGYYGTEYPLPKDVIRLIREGFIGDARQGLYKATALVYDAWVKLPSTGDQSDAIAVSLNHRDSYSIVTLR
jgi:hypothetical protein